MSSQPMYTAFAELYDMFMEDVPYKEWAVFIDRKLKGFGIKNGALVLELGCGTGSLTGSMAALGYDMIGLDISDRMLAFAREKYPDILFLNQDMRSFELYGTVFAITAVCDSLNYITVADELVQVFRLANNYLEAGGLFIFDMNTPYKYETLLAENTFAESGEEGAFIWDNIYDANSCLNEYELTLFKREEDGRFSREAELHYERCYTLREIKEALSLAGMEFVSAHAGYSDELIEEGDESSPDKKIERMVIIARERFHEGKYYAV